MPRDHAESCRITISYESRLIDLNTARSWRYTHESQQALHPGGILLGYTPSVVQVMRLREALDADARWGLAATSETLVRGWHVDGQAVRPDHRMVAHTAFLTTARRLADPPVDTAPPPPRSTPHAG